MLSLVKFAAFPTLSIRETHGPVATSGTSVQPAQDKTTTKDSAWERSGWAFI
ncbi:hypothetical protein H257_16733 [Aphanomyces astaci]|uniref:Uncharacterized protein n=1 Tax=Aphanomyces astaci TaxID=112090 RepID=W4FHD5_APHAT|nr:hypothetical protein H257_16733 [Aphanomyces astaci]ETV66927.1 hypothetical protein H257_16733 [Aphanomyces astaci]|eukprot:XP_009843568.1 hypothetical protein H257_16733 [Aphanomyces astaci]